MSSDSQSKTQDNIERVARLAELGIEVRSVEIDQSIKDLETFVEREGNREMRRNAKRAQRRKGR